MNRRELLLGVISAACTRHPPPPPPDPPEVPPPPSPPPRVECPAVQELDWHLDGVGVHAVVLAPGVRAPVLIALHGRGEALKGPELGAFGWPKDYALERALQRVCAPPLTRADFEELVTDEHLADFNRDLQEHPFRGLVVACPYLPDLDTRRDEAVADYGRWLTDVLLARVKKELPVTEGLVGIDGVSLGGNVALRVGLSSPETFAAVGALQPAIDDPRVADLVARAKSARARRPKLALRLTTSEGDYYRDVTHALSQAWDDAGIGHEMSELPGPHDYIFNRGAGVYEMIMWHRRVLV